MADVVKLEKPRKRAPGGGGTRRRRRGRGPHTALVLGGGGVTGGVYEVGALRAFDLLFVDRTINEFDVYVGTSVGSVLASMAANGVTPEQMMRVLNQRVPTPMGEVNMGTVLAPSYLELARSMALMPLRMLGVARSLLANLGSVSVMDLALELADGLPSGFYDGRRMERYMERVLGDPDRTNDFRKLSRELYLTGTDLDSCERIVFGQKGWDDVAISQAVRASTALPMVFRPADVKGRQIVDGGIRSTTNVDIAIERGAKFVMVVNPLVPYVNDFQETTRTLFGTRPRRVSDVGFAQIGYQSFKLLAHQRLHQAVRFWEQKYPGVDIVLIEPDPHDALMFETHILDFRKRTEIARHGFESVSLKLLEDYDRLRTICARHDIEISAERIRSVTEHFGEDQEQTRAWRRILEQTTGALLRQSQQS